MYAEVEDALFQTGRDKEVVVTMITGSGHVFSSNPHTIFSYFALLFSQPRCCLGGNDLANLANIPVGEEKAHAEASAVMLEVLYTSIDILAIDVSLFRNS